MVLPVLAVVVGLVGVLEAEPRWQAAQQHFAAFRYDEAYTELQQLLDAPLANEERATVLLWMGRIDADLGRVDDARTAFRRALELDPDAVLPRDTAPLTNQLLDGERARPRESVTDAVAAASPAEPPTLRAPDDPHDAPAPPAAHAAGHGEGRSLAVHPPTPISPATVVVGAGGVLAVAGVLTWTGGLVAYAVIDQSGSSQRQVVEAGERAAWAQLAGQVALAVGVATAGVGAALWLLE